ncbi:hypothetical protein EON80_13245, partial [bacterium]
VALELARDGLGESPDKPLENVIDGAAVADSLHRIERETGNLTDLIDRLLVISRLESGVQKPDFAEVDLAAMIRAVVADANFEAKSSGRRVTLTSCEEFTTLGTAPLLRSAIENVVRNALRHTRENGGVEVSLVMQDPKTAQDFWTPEFPGDGCYVSELLDGARDRTGEVEQWGIVTVRDEGAGVPSTELSEIFRPFYRAGNGRTRQSGGAGLGLTITARSMELHGGQYRLCNLEPSGLEVQLRFPGARI